MGRDLGAFETAEALTGESFPFNAVGVVHLNGGPSPETVTRALGMLRDRHPLLRARIVARKGRRFFATDGVPPIPVTVAPGDRHRWWDVAESELNTRLDAATGPMIRVTLLTPARPGDEMDLVMTMHHAILDAVSGTNLVRELLTLCGPIEGGTDPGGLPPLALAPAPDRLFPPPFRGWGGRLRGATFLGRQAVDEVRYRYRSRGGRKPLLRESGTARILPLTLPAGPTTDLIRRSRRERVTLNSVLCAALLIAVKRGFYGDEEETLLRNFIFANLRPYLNDPPADEDLGSYFATMRFTTSVSARVGLWELARLLNQQILAAARRGEKFLSVLTSRTMMKTVLGLRKVRMGSTALSYTGIATLPEEYGTTRVTGLRGFVSNFTLGPEYTAQVRLFAGRLWWDIVYLDSDMDGETATGVARELFGLLGSSDEDAGSAGFRQTVHAEGGTTHGSP